MRYFAIVLCCLLGGITSAAAQSASPPVEPPATPAVAQPVEPPAEKPADASPSQPVAQPVQASAAEPAARPVEPPTPETSKPVDQPVQTLAAQPPEASTAKPVADPVQASGSEPAAKPVEAPTAEPTAEPVKVSVAPSTESPAALPTETPAEKPAASPEQTSVAQSCPGNPDALGVSRVITIAKGEFNRIGSMQYKEDLPLKDHEVVLTFDDGPLPPYSNVVLDELAAQCVKATYFMVGEMAKAYPYMVRRIYNAGHTIGTHSQDHPLRFQRLSAQRVEQEVDGGIASVDAAIGDPKAVAPFFRIPGLGRSETVEDFLSSQSLVTWSADVVADDWFRHITPQQIVERAMRRLNEKGRGILLLHDIHPATAMALPTLLKELKAQGYHVVQVVPAGDRPKSVPELVAAHENKGAWPRLLEKNAEKEKPGKAAARHRHAKKHIVKHAPHKRHLAANAARAEGDKSAAGSDWQQNQY